MHYYERLNESYSCLSNIDDFFSFNHQKVIYGQDANTCIGKMPVDQLHWYIKTLTQHSGWKGS